jgi:hypothetical protein
MTVNIKSKRVRNFVKLIRMLLEDFVLGIDSCHSLLESVNSKLKYSLIIHSFQPIYELNSQLLPAQ